MSGICSKHIDAAPGCKLCETNFSDIIPDWEKKVKQAKEAGEHTCAHCEFVYFNVVSSCPLCGESK
tara:strand:+ start:209 stop:406 length:198 start_codon:yes stop_codon:yes gene_type:complete